VEDAEDKPAQLADDDADEEDYGPDLPPDDDDEGRFFGGGITKEQTEILDYVDDHEDDGPEKVDAAWLKKAALSFEKIITKNAELRAKFEDEPAKFMDSESDLDSNIKTLSILSQYPELYTDFAKLGCVASLVGLMAHENTDIAIDVMDIIGELTDEEVPAEDDQWNALTEAMVDADLLSLLESNLSRLDEGDERDQSGVYHALSILENLCSKEKLAQRVGKEKDLLKWLLERLKRPEPEVSQNKQYAAEILAILAQSTPENKRRLARANVVDVALELASAYRKRDPDGSSEEEEYMENLFEMLTALVDEAEGKAKFVESEGVELCLIMLKEGKKSKPAALRLLDHAVSGKAGGRVCKQIVEAGGLKTTFTMFMKGKDAMAAEHLVGIFAAMLRQLPADSPERIRTLAKFVEKDYEKVARLVTLRQEYDARIRRAELVFEQGPVDDERDEDFRRAELLSRRLDAGLFSLQTIDIILAWLAAEDDGARKKMGKLLKKNGLGLETLKATITEQLQDLDPQAADDADTRDMLTTLDQFL